MSFLDRFRRKKPVQDTTPTPEVSLKTETEIKPSLKGETDTQLILAELKGLYLLLRQHDNKLDQHDKITIEYLTEILVRKKIIPEDKRSEVEQLITQDLKENKDRQTIAEDLQKAGLSRATAYRYIKDLNLKRETETEVSLTGETETETQSHT